MTAATLTTTQLRPSRYQLAWFGTWWLVGMSAGVTGTTVSVAWGQSDTSAQEDTDYQGVTPGLREVPVGVRQGSGRVVTWPGFQMMPDGRSRFFLQVSQPVETATAQGDGEFRVTLKNTHVAVWNNHRPLVTRYFDTPVDSARLLRQGRDTVLVLAMRMEATPSVSVQASDAAGSTHHYVRVDFPPAAGAGLDN